MLLVLPLLVSCNLYSPFRQKSSTADLVEEGRMCLHDGNYSCAIEAYNAIPDAETKQEKLCMAYMAQGGLQLTALINIVTKDTSKPLSDVAQSLIPWSSDKSTALDNAKTACTAFGTLASSTVNVNKAALLQFLSLLTHCSVRLAKTDQMVATSNADTSCTTPGNSDGILTQADIGDNSNGSITSTGMCATDVSSCNEDVASMSAAGLATAGLAALGTALQNIDPSLRTSGAATNSGRSALRGSIR